MKDKQRRIGRREFLKATALAGGAATHALVLKDIEAANVEPPGSSAAAEESASDIQFPRVFKSRQLSQIAFPLGGIGTGSISLGGRGQLRDWEIFNRPDKCNSPVIVLPAIWVQCGNDRPVTKVLEARHLPPYNGTRFWGDGSDSTAGLPRFASALFSGSFPFARIDFSDPDVPVQIQLEAFSPFIPLDAEESGLPVAVLRYRVSNPSQQVARVSLAYSIDNPLYENAANAIAPASAGRLNEGYAAAKIAGLLMRNPTLDAQHPLAGSIALSALIDESCLVSKLSGWNADLLFSSPLHFWDDFSADGRLGPQAPKRNGIGSLAVLREIPADHTAEFIFLLSWHFPNRTPERCGWDLSTFVSKVQQSALLKTVIGNHYCTRFKDAQAVAEYVAEHLPELERRTRAFESTLRASTLPPAVLDAASANLSTLVTNTCFRSADGVFHGFEGCLDTSGAGAGNCTHVWNYEASVPYLFPSLSRDLRDIAFGFSTDEQGLMAHREILPPGQARLPIAAADGQMGSIVKLYLDWRQSGDTEWLRKHWPAAKRALEFAWIPGGWDADRDGVMEGAQLNTYDVEFYGPNPLMGCFYLAALRAAEEMAIVMGDRASAHTYRRTFRRGSRWLDANLFNGEYYVQQVHGIAADKIAPGLVWPWSNTGMPDKDPMNPHNQVGDGCLSDQLCGQYLAHLAGLGTLLDRGRIRRALQSIHQYNYKKSMTHVEGVTRAFAVNDEAAIVVCDYGRGVRPKIPFPYFSEAWTGLEYATAALMIFEGLLDYGLEAVVNARRRFDGERRNPWNEQEFGHHYARAMSAWAVLVALSGFSYHAGDKSITARPKIKAEKFSSFWSTGTGWGSYSQALDSSGLHVALGVTEGRLVCRTLAVTGGGSGSSRVSLAGKSLPHKTKRAGADAVVSLPEDLTIAAGQTLDLLL